MNKTYVISDRDCPPPLPDGKEWFVMRAGIALMCKDRCEKGIPEKWKAKNWVLPTFAMVTTDREAAKVEMCRQIDNLFDSFEEGE